MDCRIIIHVSTAQDATLATQVLGAAKVATHICHDMRSVVRELEAGCGALLIAEEMLQGAALQPLRLHIKSQSAWSDLPILVLTTRGSSSVEAQRALESLGNVTLLERPVRTIGLISAARSALRARERQYQVKLADRRKDEFLATLAHELRNPLAPIRTSMAILSRTQPDPATLKITTLVERQVNHLTRLVDDLLDVARIATGKVVLKPEHTTVKAVMTHALEIAGVAMQEKGHHLAVTYPDREYVLNADHARVVQSVANLLGNAAKFTAAGGSISLAAEVEGPVVTFKVRDNGRGLDQAAMSDIFELFAQAPTPGEPGNGLGIGLNLAKRFAEMHGGNIDVASDGLGKGCEFTLWLPVVVEGEEGSASVREPAETLPHAPRKVLVVDDNVDAADTLVMLLDLQGYETGVAYDGESAVSAARNQQPDIVLMDIGMPKVDGYQAARMMRAEFPELKLVALTGWGQDLDRQKAEASGFDRHLVKPVDIPTLLSTLDVLE